MLSILIPSYNHANFVIETISSVCQINVPSKRIYIIDDASSDNSAEVIENYLKIHQLEDVTFIRKECNKGLVDSLLIFLSLCKTEFVYFIASDDIAIGSGIAELVERLRFQPELQFLIGGGVNVLPRGRRIPIYSDNHVKFFNLKPENLVKNVILDYPSPILCQSSVFRLSAIKSAGAVDPEIVADDYAIFTSLLLRYSVRGVNFDFLPNIYCVEYRHHQNNSYLNIPRQARNERQVIEKLAPTHLRRRALASKIAFFALVSIRRGNVKSLFSVMSFLRFNEIGWFLIELLTILIKIL